MSSAITSKSSTPTTKNGTKPSLKIKLKVSPSILAKLAQDTAKSSKGAASSPLAAADLPSSPVDESKNEDDKSETPVGKVEEEKKKSAQPIKAGVKRDSTTLAATTNTTTTTAPKPRARPGPKRRKIETDDQQPWTVTATGPGAHKLGPKANQGAINAGLRALDRSGKPCRKWGKKNFSLKTFNGANWSFGHWSAPPKPESKPEDTENNTPSTNSDGIPAPSSNVPSVTSHQPDTKDVASTAVVTASA